MGMTHRRPSPSSPRRKQSPPSPRSRTSLLRGEADQLTRSITNNHKPVWGGGADLCRWRGSSRSCPACSPRPAGTTEGSGPRWTGSPCPPPSGTVCRCLIFIYYLFMNRLQMFIIHLLFMNHLQMFIIYLWTICRCLIFIYYLFMNRLQMFNIYLLFIIYLQDYYYYYYYYFCVRHK